MPERVDFSDHAILQLEERGLDVATVREAVENPEQVLDEGRRKVAHKRFSADGRTFLLRIVYEEVDDGKLIVTAYRTSRVLRYWRQDAN